MTFTLPFSIYYTKIFFIIFNRDSFVEIYLFLRDFFSRVVKCLLLMQTFFLNNLHFLTSLPIILKPKKRYYKNVPGTHTLEHIVLFQVIEIKCFRVQMCLLLTLILP